MGWGYIDEEPSWQPPKELPNLKGEKIISLDTETYDPRLMERGPGNVFDDGRIIGMSVAVSESAKWYLPIDVLGTGVGFPIEQIRDWANALFTKDVTVVGANLMYDIGWLDYYGIKLQGTLYDVQWVEALINEHKSSYSLDSIAKDYGLGGKVSNELYEWCAKKFGGAANGQQRKHMHEAPLRLVGPYAEGDAELPLRIRDKQLPVIEEEGLERVVDLEHRLLPMLLAMRKRGVRVDMAGRDNLAAYLDDRLRDAVRAVREVAGRDVNVNAAADIAKVFDANGWEYPLSEKAQRPSFTKSFLMESEHPFANNIAVVRRLGKMKGTFIDGYFDLAHKGRMHCMLHPLRNGDNGTISGRLSSSKANLQNIPSRDPEFAPLIRGLFVPDEGERWVCQDFSQIEYRLLAHYAVGRGADEVRQQYNNDPTTDFHKVVQDATGMKRSAAKCLNFGMVYGQGIDLTAESLNVDRDTAMAFRESYFEKAPYVKATSDLVANRAGARGWIKTIMGRRARFDTWEPANFSLSKELGNFPTREEALKVTAKHLDVDVSCSQIIKRARTYKALNALLQGSAADLMKKAMVDIWESGVCDVLGAPLLTVHDELDWSVPQTKEGDEAMVEAGEYMKHALPEIRVPVLIDTESGDDWGHIS